MITVKVHLHSAIHPSRSRNLALMTITNLGTGTKTRRNYKCCLINKRGRPYATGFIFDHPSNDVCVWRLVEKALEVLA